MGRARGRETAGARGRARKGWGARGAAVRAARWWGGVGQGGRSHLLFCGWWSWWCVCGGGGGGSGGGVGDRGGGCDRGAQEKAAAEAAVQEAIDAERRRVEDEQHAAWAAQEAEEVTYPYLIANATPRLTLSPPLSLFINIRALSS